MKMMWVMTRLIHPVQNTAADGKNGSPDVLVVFINWLAEDRISRVTDRSPPRGQLGNTVGSQRASEFFKALWRRQQTRMTGGESVEVVVLGRVRAVKPCWNQCHGRDYGKVGSSWLHPTDRKVVRSSARLVQEFDAVMLVRVQSDRG